MLIPDLVQFGIAAVLWVGVLFRFWLLLRSPLEPAYRYFCLGLVFGLTTLTLNLPGIYSALGTLVEVPNLAYLASLCSLSVGAFLMLPFYERLADPAHSDQPTRKSVVVLIGALASMVATFAFVRAPDNVPPFMFLDPDAPFVAEFLFVSLVCLTGGFILPLVRLHWRYRRIGSTFSMRFGWGRLAPAGFIVGSASHLHAFLYTLSVRLDLPYPFASVAVPAYYVLAFATFTLVGVGVSMPTWGPRLSLETLYWQARRYVLYRRLSTLWLSLYQASPEIALFPPRARVGDLVAMADIDFYLNRRVVEIRDGILKLLPFCEGDALVTANAVCCEDAVPDTERPYVVAAATLVAAARLKARGETVLHPVLVPIPDADDLDQEAATLARIAQYGAGCPLLTQVLTRLDPGSAHPASQQSQRFGD